MAYEYQPYPRMIYRGDSNMIVQNYGEEKARLADGWGLTPGFVAPEPVAETASNESWDGTLEELFAIEESVAPVEPAPVADPSPIPVIRRRGRPRKTA